jgi:hypothetical protein
MGHFRFKPASQFVERYQSFGICVLNMGDLIQNIFFFFVNSIINIFLTYFVYILLSIYLNFGATCILL